MIIEKIGILDPEGKYPNPLNKKPYSPLYSHIADTGTPVLGKGKSGNGWKHFNTYKDRNRFFKMLQNNQAVLVKAGTGTGKSVMFPKLVCHYFDYKYPIIVTVPTRKGFI